VPTWVFQAVHCSIFCVCVRCRVRWRAFVMVGWAMGDAEAFRRSAASLSQDGLVLGSRGSMLSVMGACGPFPRLETAVRAPGQPRNNPARQWQPDAHTNTRPSCGAL